MAFGVLSVLLASGLVLFGADKKKDQTPAVLVAGTVFRDNGMALAGAQVSLSAAGETKEGRKFKKMQATTNSRGEFALRVPQQPGEFRLVVKANGFKEQEKPVRLEGDAADVYFLLERASK